MKVKEAIVDILKMEGISFVSCFPPNKLINPCANSGIRTILVRQERVAVNMADGYARVSFKPAVALVAGGVGIENAFSGISQAFSDMVPILVFVDQSSTDRIGTRPVQDFDVVFTLHKVAKWVERIHSPRQTEEFMRRAFTYLRSGKTGPVVLELPEDLAEEELSTELSYRPVKGWKCAGDPEDVKAVVRALSSAKSPLLYVGEGAFYAQAWEEVKEFAELLRLPVMTTLKAKSIFPEDHPLSVGVGGRTGSKVAAHFLKKADLILAVGASLTRGLPHSVIGAPLPKGKIIVQSTIDEWDVNKDYFADYVIVGDAKLVLRQLIEEVKRQNVKLSGREGLEEEIRRLKEEWLKEWMPKLTSNEVPINPYRVVWEIIQTVDKKNTIITHDAGCPRDHLAPFYEAVTPRGYLGWGHHSTLGYSLGGAMGAKLACPDKTVINVIGDAGFGMVGMDFETAVREKIPILTVLVNNSGMGTYFEWTPSTSKLSGDYSKLAEALGGYSEKVERPDEISPALKRAIRETKSGRPALVEIITKVDVEFQTRYWRDI